jgi:hypothetical protein
MILDAPWYMPNLVIRRMPKKVIRRDLQTPTTKEEMSLQLSIQCSPQRSPKRPNSEPHGATTQQAVVKTPAK